MSTWRGGRFRDRFDSMRLASGTRLGSYEIISPLGSGGMGEVYRARDRTLGRDVALKVLSEEVARDPQRLAGFEREARMAAGLNHPNIVVLHSIEEAGGTRFITMELVEGMTKVSRMFRRLHGDPRWPRFLEKIGLA